MKKFIFGVCMIAMLATINAQETKAISGKKDKIIFAVSILPQQYFLERIGGDTVSSIVLIGLGQSPHAYEPSPAQLANLSKAKAWLLSGTDFEISLKSKISSRFTNLKIIDGTTGVHFRTVQEYEHELEEIHTEKDEHYETNIDRHTWLGYEPSKIMAAHIRDALVAIDPSSKSLYNANYDSLIMDIDTVFTELKTSLAKLRGKTVMVFHPAFGYFLDEFGMKQVAVETGGKEPTPKALSLLIGKAKAEKVPAIFVQAQFPVNAAKTVGREAGAEVVMLDPLAPDWLSNIKKMGDALKKAYE